MKDVARAAGVSQTTVSFVINNLPDVHVAAATRERVWAVVEELGYRPNALARGLRRATTDTIGFISDVMGEMPFAGRMIQGAQDAALQRGKLLLLVNTGGHRVLEDHAAAMLLDRQVDGIVYATMGHRVVSPSEHLRHVPSVLLDSEACDGSLSSVVPDEEEGAFTATSVVLDGGQRRVGLLSSDDGTPAARRRVAGYLRALESRSVPFDPDLLRQCGPGPGEGYATARALMEIEDPPDALFCSNDQMAMGAYQALSDLGRAIPGDVAVVGCDDELIAPRLRPGLSSVALPHYEMGRWAVEHLLELIQATATGATPPVVQHRMPCPYVARGSL